MEQPYNKIGSMSRACWLGMERLNYNLPLVLYASSAHTYLQISNNIYVLKNRWNGPHI